MTTIPCEQVIQIWLDVPFTRGRPRVITGPDDWGDPGTVGCHVKHVGATALSPEDHFGVYLGQHSLGYVVAIIDLDGKFVRGEVFEDQSEMKQRWQLD